MSNFRERIYQQYTSSRYSNPVPITIESLSARAPLFRKIIREHFPPERSAVVIDLGCGHGAFIHFILQAGYSNVKGIDNSPDQIDVARRLGLDVVVGGDLLQTLRSLPGASQDVVVAFDVIEHFTKAELLQFSVEVYRVLRSGGRWIIHAPNGESPFVGAVLYGDITHELAFTRGSLTQVLRASGFTDINCYEDQPIAHGMKSGLRLVLWLACRMMLRLFITVQTGDHGKNFILTQNFITVVCKTKV